MVKDQNRPLTRRMVRKVGNSTSQPARYLTRAMVWKVVDRATALLAGRGWTRRAYARDKRGLSAPATSNEAVCFCAAGALHRARHELGVRDYLPIGSIVDFNDRIARNKWDVIREIESRAERLCATLPE